MPTMITTMTMTMKSQVRDMAPIMMTTVRSFQRNRCQTCANHGLHGIPTWA